MKCILPKCDNEVTGWRLSRKYPACSAECTKIKQQNKGAKARAKKGHFALVLCMYEGCNRLIRKRTDSHGYCKVCAKKDAASATKVISYGKSYNDHRAKICQRNGKQCPEFSECSDSYDGKKFKYLNNGGVDCYEEPGSTPLLTKGDSVGMCQINI